jgi:uncharacterized cupin superfamily protein
VLDGGGTLHLDPTPARVELGAEPKTHELGPGSLVSRPAGTGICHWIEAGDEGITYLVYGTRAQNDVTYYPRKNGLWFKSAGVMIAADHISILGD